MYGLAGSRYGLMYPNNNGQKYIAMAQQGLSNAAGTLSRRDKQESRETKQEGSFNPAQTAMVGLEGANLYRKWNAGKEAGEEAGKAGDLVDGKFNGTVSVVEPKAGEIDTALKPLGLNSPGQGGGVTTEFVKDGTLTGSSIVDDLVGRESGFMSDLVGADTSGISPEGSGMEGSVIGDNVFSAAESLGTTASSVGSGLMSGIKSILSLFSDRRLKTDIAYL
jgi:hypothetical protein